MRLRNASLLVHAAADWAAEKLPPADWLLSLCRHFYFKYSDTRKKDTGHLCRFSVMRK